MFGSESFSAREDTCSTLASCGRWLIDETAGDWAAWCLLEDEVVWWETMAEEVHHLELIVQPIRTEKRLHFLRRQKNLNRSISTPAGSNWNCALEVGAWRLQMRPKRYAAVTRQAGGLIRVSRPVLRTDGCAKSCAAATPAEARPKGGQIHAGDLLQAICCRRSGDQIELIHGF